MSRSGYSEDCDNDWGLIIFRGQVASAIRGKRGQAFLRELIEALDALPVKALVADVLVEDAPAFIPPEFAAPHVCAIGAVGLKRGIPMGELDPHDHEQLADTFGIAGRMVAEIEYENDEAAFYSITPEQRWRWMRDWAVRNLKEA